MIFGPDQVVRVPCLRIFPERREQRLDPVVVEAPLELRFGDRPWMTTMRTPGEDLDLTLGLLFSEGIITTAQQVSRLAHCPEADPAGSLVRIELHPDCAIPKARSLFASSACGVCGIEAIADLSRRFAPIIAAEPIAEAVLLTACEKLRPRQKVFQLTGALHGAALLDGSGEVLMVAEDVGRHNAVDKVLGASLRQGLLAPQGRLLAVTSRVGFEIAAKAWAAGVQALVAVGAPSDLAIQTCIEAGIQLGGFATGKRINLYG
jgi:FdhD protein